MCPCFLNRPCPPDCPCSCHRDWLEELLVIVKGNILADMPLQSGWLGEGREDE